MTTLKSAAAFGSKHPLRFAVISSVLTLALAGCESGNSLLGGGSSIAPQASVVDPQSPPKANVQSAKVEIAPIIGAPEGVSRDLQAQLATAIERNKISVASGPTAKGEYVLRGYIVAAREKTGSKISYIWDVTDQAGKRANRITGEEFAAGAPGKDPWAAITPQTIQNIADKTATQIASWLPSNAGTPVASVATPASATSAATTNVAAGAATQAALPAATKTAQAVIPVTPAVANGQIPAATPAALTAAANTAATAPAASTTGSIDNGPVSTMVSSVTGAPGDGSTSLAGAIQRELTKNGVPLTSAATAQTYKVEGKVVMGAGKDGKQPIQIDWNVLDPKGKKLGTVSQKNEVPQGSLDGSWGKTADMAAAAAAQGIVKLLPQQSSPANPGLIAQPRGGTSPPPVGAEVMPTSAR